MTWKRPACSLLFLACLVQAGCAGSPRHPLANHNKPRVEPPPPSSGDDHAELQKELNLYSD
jgi:hypothetical protein